MKNGMIVRVKSSEDITAFGMNSMSQAEKIARRTLTGEFTPGAFRRAKSVIRVIEPNSTRCAVCSGRPAIPILITIEVAMAIRETSATRAL